MEICFVSFLLPTGIKQLYSGMKLKLVSNAWVSYFLNNFIKVIFLLPWCGVRAGGAEVGSVMGYGCEAESVIMFFRHFILFLALLKFIYYGIV